MKQLFPDHRLAALAALTALAAHMRRLTSTAVFGVLVGFAACIAALLPTIPVSAQGTIPSLPAAPDWLEPRGLSIVDMVGFVPEEQLRDAILVYETGTGLVQYVAGSRVGNIVTIDVRMTPRYGPGFTKVGCLAQPAAFDQWPTVVPAGTMQLFAGGRDITASIGTVHYTPAGLVGPQNNANGYLRYPRTATQHYANQSPINLPANLSCEVLFPGQPTDITARFTFNAAPLITITSMGNQEFAAHSYIGPGGSGRLGSLVQQMTRRFGTRHDAFTLNIPAEADYLFVKYGPTAFDPYTTDYDFGLAGSGTYRFELTNGGLAVDMVSSMGIPTMGNWRDSDQMGGSAFLSYSALKGRIKTPEYFLPPGVPFHQCMTSGGCPGDVLQTVYDTTFPVQVYYYKVQRLADVQYLRVPLQMVGKGWGGAAAQFAATDAPFATGASGAAIDATATEPEQTLPGKTFLPLIGKTLPPAPPPPPDDQTGCPCGWFDAQGRMLDFIPPK